MKHLALKPRMSEKAYGSSMSINTYVFDVPRTANKALVSRAITEQFNVSVIDVRLSVFKGKAKKSYRKRSRPTEGKRADIKKAYVRIAKDDNIPIFEAPEKPKETAIAKAVKKANEKQLEKTTQPAKKSRLRNALGRGKRQTQSKGSGGK